MRLRMIWDAAPHNAFTDLVRHKGAWYCAFREGLGHVSDDGRLRVIRSLDGRVWESVALLGWDGVDARDAKLSVTADGQLLLNGAVRFLAPVGEDRHQSVTWLSPDGRTWSGPHACPSGLGTWRWSVTWHGQSGYSFGYGGRDAGGTLYRTADGKRWEPVVREVFPPGQASETSLVFMPGGRAYCLLRRDPHTRFPATAALGTAQPPFTRWTWVDLKVRMGGPKLIHLALEGRLLAAVRLYDPVRTALCEIEPLACRLAQVGDLGKAAWRASEIAPLPSAGDTSYAGMVWHEGVLWVSYYSSHEGRARIYLARVGLPLPPLRGAGGTAGPACRTESGR
jgi:hypothetical protein